MSKKIVLPKTEADAAQAQDAISGIRIRIGDHTLQPETVSKQGQPGGAPSKQKLYHFGQAGGNVTGKAWTQPPIKLINDKVVYICHYLGTKQVTKVSQDEIKKALKAIKGFADRRGMDTFPEVELAINVRYVTATNVATKEVIDNCPLSEVAICAQKASTFGFIRTNRKEDTHTCIAYDTANQAEQITLTIGQAFEQAYQLHKEGKLIPRKVVEEVDIGPTQLKPVEKQPQQRKVLRDVGTQTDEFAMKIEEYFAIKPEPEIHYPPLPKGEPIVDLSIFDDLEEEISVIQIDLSREYKALLEQYKPPDL